MKSIRRFETLIAIGLVASAICLTACKSRDDGSDVAANAGRNGQGSQEMKQRSFKFAGDKGSLAGVLFRILDVQHGADTADDTLPNPHEDKYSLKSGDEKITCEKKSEKFTCECELTSTKIEKNNSKSHELPPSDRYGISWKLYMMGQPLPGASAAMGDQEIKGSNGSIYCKEVESTHGATCTIKEEG